MLMPPPSQSASREPFRLRRYLWPVTRGGNIRMLVWLTGLWGLGWLAYSFWDGLLFSFCFSVFALLARSVFVLVLDGMDWLRRRRSATPDSTTVHSQMPVLGTSDIPDAVATKTVFLRQGDTTQGPFGLDELRAKVASGEVSSSDYVWREGWPDWRRVADVEEYAISSRPPLAPTALPTPPTTARLAGLTAQPTTIHLVLKYGTICFCGLLAFVFVLLMMGVGKGGSVPAEATAMQQPSPPPPPEPLRPEQVAERLRQSTVRIDAGFKVKGLLIDDTHAWLGSGVILEKSHGVYWILSNAHVVGSDSVLNAKLFMEPVVLQYVLMVTMPDGRQSRPVEVRINRYLKDFALIAVPDSAGNYTPLPSSTARLDQGRKVFAMGHPQGLNSTFTSGVVSSWRTFKTRLGNDYEVIQTDATINHGNSGGPLVDEFASLVGINTFTLYRDQQAQGLNFAVSALEIARSIKAGEMVTFPLEPGRIGPFVLALNRGAVRQ